MLKHTPGISELKTRATDQRSSPDPPFIYYKLTQKPLSCLSFAPCMYPSLSHLTLILPFPPPSFSSQSHTSILLFTIPPPSFSSKIPPPTFSSQPHPHPGPTALPILRNLLINRPVQTPLNRLTRRAERIRVGCALCRCCAWGWGTQALDSWVSRRIRR
jgi:hypothetical protein